MLRARKQHDEDDESTVDRAPSVEVKTIAIVDDMLKIFRVEWTKQPEVVPEDWCSQPAPPREFRRVNWPARAARDRLLCALLPHGYGRRDGSSNGSENARRTAYSHQEDIA